MSEINATSEEKTDVLWSLGCGSLAPFNTPVTAGGSGWYCNGGVMLPERDKAYSFGVSGGFTAHDLYNKLFSYANPDIPGSYTNNSDWNLGVKFGDAKREGLAYTSDGRPWFALRSASNFGILFGNASLTTPDTTLPSGRTYPGSSESFKTSTLTRENSIGFEFWPGDGVYIMPEAGFYTSITHFFGDKTQLQERPHNSLGIGIYLGVSVGFGDFGSKVTKSEELTAMAMAYYFAKAVHSLGYNYVSYETLTDPQALGLDLVHRALGRGAGTSGGNAWMTGALLSISRAMDATNQTEATDFHIKAPEIGKILGVILETGKMIGYLAAGRNGNVEDSPLITSGLVSLNNLATIGMYEAGVSEKHLPLVAYALGFLELLASRAASGPAGQAIGDAGMTTSTGWMMSPEKGRTKYIASTRREYSPLTYVGSDSAKSGWAGSIGVTNSYKDSILRTKFRFTSPALRPDTLGKLGINSVQPYQVQSQIQGTEVSNYLEAGLGVGKDVPLGSDVHLDVGAGVNQVVQIDSVANRLGLGVYANLGLKYKGLGLGIEASAYKTFGDYGDHGVKITTSVSLDF